MTSNSTASSTAMNQMFTRVTAQTDSLAIELATISTLATGGVCWPIPRLIVTINLGIGQQTPPVASVLMVASSIAKESVWAVTRVNVWFIAVLLAILLLVTYVPVTGLGLVNLFYR